MQRWYASPLIKSNSLIIFVSKALWKCVSCLGVAAFQRTEYALWNERRRGGGEETLTRQDGWECAWLCTERRRAEKCNFGNIEEGEKRKGPNKGEQVVWPHSGDHPESTNAEGQLQEGHVLIRALWTSRTLLESSSGPTLWGGPDLDITPLSHSVTSQIPPLYLTYVLAPGSELWLWLSER